MPQSVSDSDIESVLQRLDIRSPERLIRALAEELVRINRAHATLETRVSMMETLSAASDRLLASAEAYFDYPKTVRIDASGSSTELLGFYQLEYAQDSAPTRWTGPERHFSIQFFVSRQAPTPFDLLFGKFFVEDPVDQLRAFVDGEEIPLAVSGAVGRYVASGELPPRKHIGGTVLTFVVPSLDSPASKGSEDKRVLGLLFIALTVGAPARSA